MNGTAGATVDTKLDELLPRRFTQARTDVERPDFLVGLSVIGDLIMLLAGFVAGYWIRFESGLLPFGREPLGLRFADYLGLIGLGSLFLLLTFGYLNLYHVRSIPDFRNAAAILFKGMTFWLFAFLSLNFAVRLEPTASRIYLLVSYATCLTGLLAWRWAFHRVLQRESIASALRQRILFIGWSKEAARITTRIEQDPNRPYEVVGWLPAPLGQTDLDTPEHVRMLGDCTELAHILKNHRVDVVILADLGLIFEEIVGLSNVCEKELVEFKIIPSYFQILLSGLKLEPISGVPILGVSELPLDRTLNRCAKRVVDIMGGCVGLALSAPILFVLAVLIHLESPGPIFYRQTRTGRNGMPFKIIKLRSMRLNADTDGALFTKKDDPRRLRIGVFMREWNLDELPQFWNVLKGDMSLVGPRPEVTELIASYRHQIPHYNARLACKPGMTGWAQINGLRGNTNLEERVRYDLHYLENWTLWFDFQTMFQTFFRRENAY